MTKTQAELDESSIPTVTPPAERGRHRRRRPRPSWAATALAVGAYLVLAVLANWNAWTIGATRALQLTQDPKLNTWLVAWTPFAVTHGVNPLFSHWVNVPFGRTTPPTSHFPSWR